MDSLSYLVLVVCLVSQLAELSSDQLLLSLGLRSIMRERGLDPQEDAALKQALPTFLRHASVVRVGKAKVGEAIIGALIGPLPITKKVDSMNTTGVVPRCLFFSSLLK